MNRKKGIVFAATMTGLVLIAVVVMGFSKVGSNSAGAMTAQQPEPELTATTSNIDDLQTELLAWQQYSQELEQTVGIMQAREAQYQQRLEAANQTIIQLQNVINQNGGNRAQPFFGGGEAGEHEFGEFDD